MNETLTSSRNDIARAFVQRHQADIVGILHGWDRLRLQGTLRSLYHPSVMDYYLKQAGVLWKDFKTFVTDLTDRVRQAAAALAIEHHRPMIYLPSSSTSKEDAARQIQERDQVVFGADRCVQLRGAVPAMDCTGQPSHPEAGTSAGVG